MSKTVGRGIIVAAGTLLAAVEVLAQGSNRGSYATQLAPSTIAGKVTSGGVPVAGARVETVDGHLATTDAGGNYTLFVEAPGVYTVRVTAGSRAAGPVQTTVAQGQTATVNFTSLRPRRQPRPLLSGGAGR